MQFHLTIPDDTDAQASHELNYLNEALWPQGYYQYATLLERDQAPDDPDPPILSPRTVPVYDASQNAILAIPKALIPALAGLIGLYELPTSWADPASGYQIALLLQERLITHLENIAYTDQENNFTAQQQILNLLIGKASGLAGSGDLDLSGNANIDGNLVVAGLATLARAATELVTHNAVGNTTTVSSTLALDGSTASAYLLVVFTATTGQPANPGLYLLTRSSTIIGQVAIAAQATWTIAVNPTTYVVTFTNASGGTRSLRASLLRVR